eukprot:scaffold89674_cov25-Tisochrysis_lutea.AAC.1
MPGKVLRGAAALRGERTIAFELGSILASVARQIWSLSASSRDTDVSALAQPTRRAPRQSREERVDLRIRGSGFGGVSNGQDEWPFGSKGLSGVAPGLCAESTKRIGVGTGKDLPLVPYAVLCRTWDVRLDRRAKIPVPDACGKRDRTKPTKRRPRCDGGNDAASCAWQLTRIERLRGRRWRWHLARGQHLGWPQ